MRLAPSPHHCLSLTGHTDFGEGRALTRRCSIDDESLSMIRSRRFIDDPLSITEVSMTRSDLRGARPAADQT